MRDASKWRRAVMQALPEMAKDQILDRRATFGCRLGVNVRRGLTSDRDAATVVGDSSEGCKAKGREHERAAGARESRAGERHRWMPADHSTSAPAAHRHRDGCRGSAAEASQYAAGHDADEHKADPVGLGRDLAALRRVAGRTEPRLKGAHEREPQAQDMGYDAGPLRRPSFQG